MMVAALLALAGAALLAYGWIDDQATAILLGFLALLFALGLHELPIWRSVADAGRQIGAGKTIATDDELPLGELVELDFRDVKWDWPHEENRVRRAA